jgi:hypothetical protein
MTRLRSLIKEVLTVQPKEDCGCGCGGCDKNSPIITEGRIKKAISEGLTYHVENKIPLHESVYRIGSEKHFNLINEARKLWTRGLIEVSKDDQAILETHLGHFGMYEGEEVPLDMPMIHEEKEYYVTYNKGRGQGKGLVKSKESNYEEPRVFSKEEAEEYAKGAESRSRQMTAYWVSDKDMNKLNEAANSGASVQWPDELDSYYGMVTFKKVDEFQNGSIAKYDIILNKTGEVLDSNEFQFLSNLEYMASDYALPKGGTQSSGFGESLEEATSKYPDFDLDKNIKYQDTSISSGMWRYTGKEQGGKGVYRNLMNDQFLGFSSDDFDFFKKHLGSHFDISESLDEVDRYSGFDRNPEDPDSEPFEPTGSVSEFREDLRALFGKFKGDLRNPDFIKGVAEIMVNWKSLLRSQLNEAKKKKEKKDPPLNKPKRGGSKAYYVYVRDPKTKKIKKVSFGSGGLRAKIKNKKARNAFAARHNCKNKKDRTKAGYWSCNLPRYAEQLGLGSKMNTFW